MDGIGKSEVTQVFVYFTEGISKFIIKTMIKIKISPLIDVATCKILNQRTYTVKDISQVERLDKEV